MWERDRPLNRGSRRRAGQLERRPEPYPGAGERARPLFEVSDTELVDRISANEAEAYHECMARFGSLLHELALRLGAGPDRAWKTVTLVLDDVMDRLRMHRYPRNRSLGGYLVIALRRRVRDELRNRAVRERVERDAATDTDVPGQKVVRSLCSEHSWKATRPPDESDENDGSEHGMLPTAVQALHDALVAQLDADDRRLLDWRGDHVVQREMAEWLGEAHGTTRNRLSRIRGEMVRATRRYLASLESDRDRAVIERYLAGRLRCLQGGSHRLPPRSRARNGSEGPRTAAERAAEDDDA